MPHRRPGLGSLLAVQGILLGAASVAWTFSSGETRNNVTAEVERRSAFHAVPVNREKPLRIAPLYNRPDFVSDEELAACLKQIQPRFERHKLVPNYVEHALRVWGIDATFQDPAAMSGPEMVTFLTDNRQFVKSWGEQTQPLLIERGEGFAVRWNKDPGASVHHDHMLASLSEAGIGRDHEVYGPSLRTGLTIRNVINESLRDFRLDERETEWTALAFGLWIAPETNHWIGGDGRRYSFDLIAERLMRGQKQLGVCVGTHRVYSLAVLLRLDEQYKILSPEMHDRVYHHLESIRDVITKSQLPDGHWPSNWPDGEAAVAKPIDEVLYKQVIATGHHLEWMAIAPKELHIPEPQLKKAFEWIIKTTVAQTPKEILERYTFFSHVGNALSLWRSQHPAEYWKSWEATHPFVPSVEPVVTPAPSTEAAH
jgi:hypothetical protein